MGPVYKDGETGLTDKPLWVKITLRNGKTKNEWKTESFHETSH